MDHILSLETAYKVFFAAVSGQLRTSAACASVQSDQGLIKVLKVICLKVRINSCHAEKINMPRPLINSSQPDYLIQVVDTNSHT